MLPIDLVKICIGYFLIKMDKNNWNNIEMERVREYEFDRIKRLENFAQVIKSMLGTCLARCN